MTIGQIVDYCASYNNRNKDNKTKAPNKRKASQADWDAFFG